MPWAGWECPFAPGASENTATEDLLCALRADRLHPETLVAPAELSHGLLAELGEAEPLAGGRGRARSPVAAFPSAAARERPPVRVR